MAVADAVVILWREGARVLAVRRAAGIARPGHWSAPTGRVEPGETQADTVVREAREELGVEVRPLRKVWQCATDDARFVLHWWLVEHVRGLLAPDPAEVAEARWVTAPEYLALEPGFAVHREFFERVWPQLVGAA